MWPWDFNWTVVHVSAHWKKHTVWWNLAELKGWNKALNICFCSSFSTISGMEKPFITVWTLSSSVAFWLISNKKKIKNKNRVFTSREQGLKSLIFFSMFPHNPATNYMDCNISLCSPHTPIYQEFYHTPSCLICDPMSAWVSIAVAIFFPQGHLVIIHYCWCLLQGSRLVTSQLECCTDGSLAPDPETQAQQENTAPKLKKKKNHCVLYQHFLLSEAQNIRSLYDL